VIDLEVERGDGAAQTLVVVVHGNPPYRPGRTRTAWPEAGSRINNEQPVAAIRAPAAVPARSG
jgi:hypothetical protein